MDVRVLRWSLSEIDPDTIYEAPLMTRGTYYLQGTDSRLLQ